MSILTVLAAEAHELAPLVLPVWAFPAIAAAFFIVTGLITWSFRDVAQRHDKVDAAQGHDEHTPHGH